MPRIPEYPIQDVGARELVQHGPNIEIDTASYAKSGAVIAHAGEQLATFGQQLMKAQVAADVSKRIGDTYKELGQMQLDYQLVDPLTVRKDAEEKIGKLKERMMEGLPGIAQQTFAGHFDRIASTKFVTIAGEAQKRAIDNMRGDYTLTLDTLARNGASDTEIDKIIDVAAASGVIHGDVAAKLRIETKDKKKYYQGLMEIDKNPVDFQQNIDKYGFDAKQKDQLYSHANTVIRQRQQENELKLSQLDDNNQVTQDLIKTMRDNKSITVSSYDKWYSYLEGKNKGVDKETSDKNYIKALIQIDDENNPLIRQDYLKRVASGELAMDRTAFTNIYDRINRRDKGDEKSIETYEKAQVNAIKSMLGPYAPKFLNQYFQEKKTNNWTTQEEIDQNLTRIADPYMKKRFRPLGGQPQQQQGWWQRNFGPGQGEQQQQPLADPNKPWVNDSILWRR